MVYFYPDGLATPACIAIQDGVTFDKEVNCITYTASEFLFSGPHQFVLDRLMAIFYSIVDEKVPASAVILSQLSSLVTLRFLSQVSANEQLDSPKYKCLVSLDLIKAIARQLEFDIGQYLYDFVNQ